MTNKLAIGLLTESTRYILESGVVFYEALQPTAFWNTKNLVSSWLLLSGWWWILKAILSHADWSYTFTAHYWNELALRQLTESTRYILESGVEFHKVQPTAFWRTKNLVSSWLLLSGWWRVLKAARQGHSVVGSWLARQIKEVTEWCDLQEKLKHKN